MIQKRKSGTQRELSIKGRVPPENADIVNITRLGFNYLMTRLEYFLRALMNLRLSFLLPIVTLAKVG